MNCARENGESCVTAVKCLPVLGAGLSNGCSPSADCGELKAGLSWRRPLLLARVLVIRLLYGHLNHSNNSTTNSVTSTSLLRPTTIPFQLLYILYTLTNTHTDIDTSEQCRHTHTLKKIFSSHLKISHLSAFQLLNIFTSHVCILVMQAAAEHMACFLIVND